ncbi:GntR family transcriptional regulator [Enterococcus sp. JM4C]|uniref:GntR family transcriptional regulator n=1 Tax=Candidatus Enterococcus huntleyi TaxID=1857217 RepID=UPI001379901B|nr:GntR family transcriptional regulator [Enterococcus sp. JM4C]KAF1299481.1 GntR family transcriptional regulator [Enterococcus sp. JM4C]
MKKYVHIFNDMKNKIIDGTYVSNQKLPSEKQLSEHYQVSKMTMKQALDNLVDDGLIIKKRGSGTFVKDLSADELVRMSLTNQFRGKTAEYPQEKVTSKILAFSVINPSPLIQQKLNISAEDFVYFLHRVRKINDQPFVIEETHMPVSLIRDLKRSHVEQSIYEYIETELQYKIQSVHRKITVRQSTAAEVSELDMTEGDPVGIVEQVGYLSNGAAFEYSISTHRYDRFKSEMILKRESV